MKRKLFLLLCALLGMLTSVKAALTAGDYLIQNVATGQYLVGGHDWGTHSSTHAMPQWFTLSGSGTTYTIDSHQFNNETAHFIGSAASSAPYVDAGYTDWTIEEVSGSPGVYTLKSGKFLASGGKDALCTVVDAATANTAKWRFISRTDFVSSLTSATLASGVDATAYIQDPELKRNGNFWAFNDRPWTITAFSGSGNAGNFNQGWDGNNASCAESFQSNNGFKAVQKLTGLKPGWYTLRAHGFYRQDGEDNDHLPYLFVDDKKSYIPLRTGSEDNRTKAYTAFLGGKYSVAPILFQVSSESQEIQIGYACENTKLWVIFGQTQLTYFGNTAPTSDSNITGFIVNPSFETGNFEGWTNSEMETQTNTSFDRKEGTYYAQRWHNAGDKGVVQSLIGLPNGTYKLTLSAYATNETAAKVYAVDKEVPVTTSNDYDVYFDYDSSKDDFAFGFRAPSCTNSSWVAIDKFRLTYSPTMPTLTPLEGAMNSTVSANQTSAVSTYNSSKTVTNYYTAVTAIKAAEASIAAYGVLNTALTTYGTKAATLDSDGQSVYDVNEIQAAYDGGTYSDNEAVSAATTVHDIYVTAVKAQGINADMTDAISNPNFETSDLSAWNFHGKSEPKEVSTTYNDCEFFDQQFDMSQTLTGMKKGTYEVSFQAFQRPGAADQTMVNAYVEGTWESAAELYTTAEVSQVKHIMDGASTTTGNNSSKVTYKGEDYYIPNGMEGARVWFDRKGEGDIPLYTATARAVVTENNGSLEFGFRGDVRGGSKWLIFANFQMKYIDTDVLIAVTEAERVIGVAEALVESKMNASILSNLETAISDLQDDVNAAKAESDSYVGGTNYSALNIAIANAEASITVYETITASYNSFVSLAEGNMTSAGQTAFAESSAVSNYNDATYEDSETAIAAFTTTYNTLLKDYHKDTADMTSLIENPSFETGGYTGWNVNSGAGIYVRNQGELSNMVGNYYAFVQGSQSERTVSQTINLLPQGKYILSVNAKANTDAGSVTLNLGAFSTPIPSNATAATYTVAYESGESANAQIKIAATDGEGSLRRCFFDNFTLTYYTELPDVAGVDALLAQPMNNDVRTTLVEANTAYTDNKTAANYNALQAAIINAQISTNAYSSYAYYEVLAQANLITAGIEAFHSDETVAPYYNGTYEDDDKNETAIKNAYISALKTYPKAGVDMTTFITNPSFEDGKTGWSVNYGSSTSHNSDEIQGGAGSRYFKSWRNTSDGGYVYQTINLSAGHYRLSVLIGAHQATNAKRFVKAGTTVQKDDVHHDYTRERLFVDFELSTAGNIEISAGCENSDEYQADDFRLTYLGNASATMQVSGTAKIGTFCAPFAVTIPDGVTAYEASMSSDEWVHLEEIGSGVIGAGKPVILSITANEKFSQTFYGANTAENPDDTGVLKGLYVAESKESGANPYYILQYVPEDGAGFYQVPTGQTRDLAANRCYLQPESATSPARIAIGGEDDPSAINEVEVIESEAKTMKDGKYFVKGRIVIVKNGKAFSTNGQKLN